MEYSVSLTTATRRPVTRMGGVGPAPRPINLGIGARAPLSRGRDYALR